MIAGSLKNLIFHPAFLCGSPKSTRGCEIFSDSGFELPQGGRPFPIIAITTNLLKTSNSQSENYTAKG